MRTMLLHLLHLLLRHIHTWLPINFTPGHSTPAAVANAATAAAIITDKRDREETTNTIRYDTEIALRNCHDLPV